MEEITMAKVRFFFFCSLSRLTLLAIYLFKHNSALIDVCSFTALYRMTVFVSENDELLVWILPNNLCESMKRHTRRAQMGRTSEITATIAD